MYDAWFTWMIVNVGRMKFGQARAVRRERESAGFWTQKGGSPRVGKLDRKAAREWNGMDGSRGKRGIR